ncbi:MULTISPECIES: reverse transcriptase domain-containing protein [Mammaliicoccus]|uniref:Reverse transcriptase domain-containing protein n=4 Tax=Mammaliicoccus sciuri TaxID=1296 RepID=A0ABT7HZ85_MAMSC|nr:MULTISPECIES: reverse transcriptase domain-containing protein [Mammaliicoccus]MCJ0914743.1 reverse transcriptase/maturase family protein [Mammaliicoccus sciuri]MDL0113517.1 reverse transcriptase domain-containing protein [Mammaliicoccus sciuri]MDL0117476.1 reverse transcriptase domain-containing protein [Mammaliicoccus sciuri]WQJ66168.1 reverse transcriptase domain-containing protein [Mammaliicoccus sciuri]
MNRKLLKSQFKLNNLIKISNKCVKFNTAIGIDNMTHNRFKEIEPEIISKIRSDVLCDSYRFTSYKEKLILKGRNELPRCISIPTMTDKVCLKALNETLKNYYPEYKRTKLPQEWIKKIKEEFQYENRSYFLKIDIKSFFDEIEHDILLKKLKNRIKDKKTINLIKKAIETPTYPSTSKNDRGLPQGIAISNILSNIYLKEFDRYYNEKENVTYIRYVDDLLLLFPSEEEANSFKEEIRVKLKEDLSLEINESKCRVGNIYNDKFNFLGYDIGNKSNSKDLVRIVMNKKSINKLENKLLNIITAFKRDKKYSLEKMIFNLNLLITGCIINNKDDGSHKHNRYGWLFHYLQITDLTILYHLDMLVKRKVSEITTNEKIKEIKKFSKTYFEMKYNLQKSHYIFKPDEIDLSRKRYILKNFYNIEPDEENVEKKFKDTIFSQVKHYEKDIISQIS